MKKIKIKKDKKEIIHMIRNSINLHFNVTFGYSTNLILLKNSSYQFLKSSL